MCSRSVVTRERDIYIVPVQVVVVCCCFIYVCQLCTGGRTQKAEPMCGVFIPIALLCHVEATMQH